jgi:DNA-binding NarL/FixJ family response regulator
VRIVLADDHTLVRAGIRSLLVSIPDVQVVAESDDGRETLDLIVRHRPDVALIDIGMPGLSGLEVARRVAKESPRTRVIILSMHGDRTHVTQALRAGVAGYLVKGAAVAELPLALEAVMRGETYLTPKISRTVVREYLHAGQEQEADQDPLKDLTERQREILHLIAEGRSTREMAGLLHVSVKTIETHRLRLMDRLDIHDVAGLVRFAVRAGLVSSAE